MRRSTVKTRPRQLSRPHFSLCDHWGGVWCVLLHIFHQAALCHQSLLAAVLISHPQQQGEVGTEHADVVETSQ